MDKTILWTSGRFGDFGALRRELFLETRQSPIMHLQETALCREVRGADLAADWVTPLSSSLSLSCESCRLCPVVSLSVPSFYRGVESAAGEKKPININNIAGLSRKWVGVKLFMCFPVFFEGKKGKHINKIPRKSQEKAGRVPG